MSTLLERRYVRCPYNLAQRYLAAAVGDRAASGASETLPLQLSVPGGKIEKAVAVTFGADSDPMHFDQPWHIHWKPEGGPYPEFDGDLTVRADETYETSILELRGSYRPPGGSLGAAFDWALGGRIASATAQTLLDRIGTQLEAHYASDEAAKRSSPS